MCKFRIASFYIIIAVILLIFGMEYAYSATPKTRLDVVHAVCKFNSDNVKTFADAKFGGVPLSRVIDIINEDFENEKKRIHLNNLAILVYNTLKYDQSEESHELNTRILQDIIYTECRNKLQSE